MNKKFYSLDMTIELPDTISLEQINEKIIELVEGLGGTIAGAITEVTEDGVPIQNGGSNG